MRGIPRKAVELNLSIAGTDYRAQDIADTSDICNWCDLMYGIDMTQPGAQAYYDSVIRSLNDMGVDFIKADDITQFPAEIDAVADAIQRINSDIILSLSPGDLCSRLNLDTYHRADMLRLSGDVWDNRNDLNKCFDRWELFENDGATGFWLDLDMIPFGELSVLAKKSDSETALLSGLGCRRQSQLTPDQKKTFITMRALAASPLFMGGELTMTGDDDFALITHPEMLACNQNGIIGKRIFFQRNVDIRKTPRKSDPSRGWIGIFNRHERPTAIRLSPADLQLPNDSVLHDIWNDHPVTNLTLNLSPDSVLFLRYQTS